MTKLAEYPKIAAGKVRELYAVGDDHLLLVTSDRISAYDFVLDTPIPDKGRVLTAMSVFWFTQLADLIPNHLVAWDDPRIPAEVLGRALLVRRLDMLPVEAVARGYLTGSGFADYQRTGSVCGVELPGGLVESARLPSPIFTPATKAELGEHDENVSFETVAAQIGLARATEVRDATLAIYRRGAEFAAERGILLADTKFEFGLDAEGRLVLADEVLTPDSSRYWPADGYEPGHAQPSFDKQYVRDWLTGPSGWDRASNTQPPPLPDDVVAATRARYVEAYERISGLSLADWPGA
ncbi:MULTISPECIES: phosphoribosylaminoimidazolesuccinocarboxamide synthase [unclassified Amycolatopsis]|uniref:phosphoribosylaminoimidazolesuccinocarboxamide synthase n=1 Tax=unclassified Amycolatopsis TaxID=2618356 RepID=UPI001C6951A2|nr:phosphoribosylaminoimidazolesuccinocarboxamide synthase [Amycolatopsis sp. DSM 110486]QYN23878.1 phosphoribosylaminoimidazolesuccinocarboxamide synthase [Amycolatopsis sp. DSM 110486]